MKKMKQKKKQLLGGIIAWLDAQLHLTKIKHRMNTKLIINLPMYDEYEEKIYKKLCDLIIDG